jgi:diaminopimelate decarboxylase
VTAVSWLATYPEFDARNLVARYGSPLLVFFPEVLAANVRRLKEALAGRHANHILCYSVKTNYLPYVVRRVAELGVVPEIVSGLELELAERLGLLNADVVVNGPLKTEAELRRIIACRCRINVDNPTELEIIEGLGRAAGRRVDVGLRVASEIGETSWERFGFPAGRIVATARLIRDTMPHIRLVGLHIHGGTNIVDLTYYGKASRLLCDLAVQLRGAGLAEVTYLDLGGGYATDCPFKDHDDLKVPSAIEYVDAIAGPLHDTFGAAGPTLIVEPGRYLIDDAFVLLTTVERLRDEASPQVILDAGINVFPSAMFRRHRVACMTPRLSPPIATTLFGPLCMGSDCLGENVLLPAVQPGDILAVDYAGAYSVSQSWTFIRFQPAVVALEGTTHELVRRRQSIDDFLARDVL